MREWSHSELPGMIETLQSHNSWPLYKQFLQCDFFDVHCVIQCWCKYTVFNSMVPGLHERVGYIMDCKAKMKLHSRKTFFSSILLHAPARNAVMSCTCTSLWHLKPVQWFIDELTNWTILFLMYWITWGFTNSLIVVTPSGNISLNSVRKHTRKKMQHNYGALTSRNPFWILDI